MKKFTLGGGFGANGALNFAQGVYKLEFDEAGKCIEIVHMSGARITPPAHVSITRSFVLKNNHLDFRATLELPPIVFKLSDFFPADSDFMQDIYTPGKKWKVIDQISDRLAKAKQQQQQDDFAETMVTLDAAIVDNARKARTQVNLDRARVALAASKERRQSKKVVSSVS